MKKSFIVLVIICSFFLYLSDNIYAQHPTSTQVFIDNGDGTITDSDTGLMWLKDANYAVTVSYPDTDSYGMMTWDIAVSLINDLNSDSYLGYNDWRLPVTDISCSGFCPEGELGHLFHVAGINRDDNWGPFENVFAAYWTGSEASPTQAMVQVMISGGQYADDKNLDAYAAWAVRGGTVVPEPVSSILFIVGGATLGFRRFRKKFKE